MYPIKKSLLLFIILSNILFVFAAAKNSSFSKKNKERPDTENADDPKIKSVIASLYTELHLKEAGLNKKAFTTALLGFQKLDSTDVIKNDSIITIIDFSQPSINKRLYVIDLKNKQILFNTLVAHGKNSGTLWPKSFSNKPASLKSSPGFYVTAETYIGDNGYSLRLDGQEKSINDNARRRSIVIHGASYVDESAISDKNGLGRSWGCPAVPVSEDEDIINTIKEGTCLFIYNPDPSYLKHSPILNHS